MNAETLKYECAGFTGSDGYILHGLLKNLFITHGVDWLRKNANAFWLIDAIASHQSKAMKDPMLREFQLWELKKNLKNGPNGATLTCSRDTNDPVIVQEIEYTDFPLDDEGFKLYAEPGIALVKGKETMLPVVMLPSER